VRFCRQQEHQHLSEFVSVAYTQCCVNWIRPKIDSISRTTNGRRRLQLIKLLCRFYANEPTKPKPVNCLAKQANYCAKLGSRRPFRSHTPPQPSPLRSIPFPQSNTEMRANGPGACENINGHAAAYRLLMCRKGCQMANTSAAGFPLCFNPSTLRKTG